MSLKSESTDLSKGILTNDILKDLVIVNSESLKGQSPIAFYEGKGVSLYVYPENKISISDAETLLRIYTKIREVEHVTIGTKEVMIYPTHAIPLVFKVMVSEIKEAKKLSYDIDPVEHIRLWISLFQIYENFGCLYQAYCLYPDEGVRIIDIESIDSLDILPDYPKNLFIASNGKEDAEIAEQDVRATCHLIIFFLMKSISEDANHLELVIKKRRDAIAANLKTPVLDLLFSPKFFKNLSITMRFYPKLREIIFQIAQGSACNHPEMSTALSLIEYAGMASIKASIEFIDSSVKTEAHSHVEVVEESKRFLEAVDAIKKKLSPELFPFYRLLLPSDYSLKAALFPNLYTAALSYCTHFTAQSYSKIKCSAKATIKEIAHYATVIDIEATKEICKLEPLVEFDDEMKKFMKEVLHFKTVDPEDFRTDKLWDLYAESIKKEAEAKKLQKIGEDKFLHSNKKAN